MTAQEPLVLGIDLGGTNTRVGLVSRSRGLVRVEITATPAEAGPEAVLQRIQLMARKIIAEEGQGNVLGAGIGAPGPLDLATGTVATMPNLPNWESYPIQAKLSQLLGLSVALINDADAAALGEHRYGVGRGVEHLVYISLGTGVGGGLIIGGRHYAGAAGAAGEVGHMMLDPNGPLCGCGLRGCLEAFSSGSGLERQAVQRLRAGDMSKVLTLAGSVEGVTAAHIAEAARAGDALARELLSQGATRLAQATVSLVHVLNPQMVIYGGGLLAVADLLIDPAIVLAKERMFPQHRRNLRFAYSELGADAGVLGAASLALDTFVPR